MNEFDPVVLGVERDRLLAEARTLLMAAPGGDAMPEMGVTPLVRMNGASYILSLIHISEPTRLR